MPSAKQVNKLVTFSIYYEYNNCIQKKQGFHNIIFRVFSV